MLILACNYNYGQNKKSVWEGLYGYDVPGPIDYSLSINADNTCVYSGEGIQTYFKLGCKGFVKADKYELYYVKTLEGGFNASEWMDKDKPMMTLYYSGKLLYTDQGQMDKDAKGGKLLFKKIFVKEYVCPMHQQEKSSKSGSCNKCEMDLELKKGQ